MEESLALLRRNGLLEEWHDQKIVPGRRIRPEIRAHMDAADILVYLLSPAFIASTECMDEWDYGALLASKDKPIYRIPIIVTHCSWIDMLGNDDVKALPDDGEPISAFSNVDAAWLQVYNGIKATIEDLRSVFKPKIAFLDEINESSFASQEESKLSDLYVFLDLALEDPRLNDDGMITPVTRTWDDLMAMHHAIIHGVDKSGKTTLAHQLYGTLQDRGHPVLLVEPTFVHGRRRDTLFAHAYESQYYGDYAVWSQHQEKVVIFDNVSSDPRLFEIIAMAREDFKCIFLFTQSDMFYSYFRDEARLQEFAQLRIEPLTFNQQEQLIRKHLEVSESYERVTDGLVDDFENRVNSIVIANSVVPRYPFYVLSILQTYESYMPRDLSISSHAHCYHALIVGRLIKSGISDGDVSLNACFNFLEHLAFGRFTSPTGDGSDPFDFGTFTRGYRDEFVIEESVVCRLSEAPYEILRANGEFHADYIYYFFLGRALARDDPARREVLRRICRHSYRDDYHLALLFTIHHTADAAILEDILIRTMCTVEDLDPATLSPGETERFNEILLAVPEDIGSGTSVEANRLSQRAAQTEPELDSTAPDDSMTQDSRKSSVNIIYRIFKNTKLLGQVLRNQYGGLQRYKIAEIVDIVVDSGLRLINIVLADETQINTLAIYLSGKHEEWSAEQIRRGLALLSFQWSMVVIQQIVEAINVPDIRVLVESVVSEHDTPAYDLIGYFATLSSARVLSERERRSLAALLSRHDDMFVRRVVSLQTQRYLNTHRSSRSVEQAIYSLLGLKYRPRMLRPR